MLRRLAIVALVVLCAASRLYAGDVAGTIAEAERVRASDKSRARQLLDGAERELAAAPNDAQLAKAQLLECRWADTPPQAYRATATGLPAAERAHDDALRAKLVACRAIALWIDGKEQDAERDFLTAIALATRAGDAPTRADALASAGSLQYNRGAMADALANVQAAYRENVRLGRDKERLDALTLIANVYADAHVAQYDRAIEYYRQLAAEYEKHGQPNDVADTLFNIGATFETKGNFVAAETEYRRALAMFEKLGRADDIAFTRRALGSSMMKQGRAAEALPLLDGAVAYYQTQSSATNIAMARQFRGMAYRRLGRLDDALRDLGQARVTFEKENNVRFLEKNADETALVYAQLGDWKNAYEARKRHAELQDSLAASRRDELSSRLRVEFDAEKTEQENRALARENALRSAALRESKRSQRLQLIIIVLTALLAIALAVLFRHQVASTRRMRAMALTDELTRLPNRRHILAAMEIAFDAARRERRPAAAIVFDIDRFKRINDTYGHAAGDVVLRGVAHACRLALRADDQLGRIGGEEFLVVLHDATRMQAGEIAERLRAAVEAIDFSAVAAGLRVTISLGVSVANEYDPHAALAAADALLYRAKESGRNRVEMAVAADPA